MAEASATPLGNVISVPTTDDGTQVLLRSQQTDGTEAIFAIERSQIGILIDFLAYGNIACQKRIGIQQWNKDYYTPTWCEISNLKVRKVPIFSLTFGSGGTLNFSLPGAMPALIIAGLRVYLGQSILTEPNKLLN